MDNEFLLSAYNYLLPEEQIAQHPAARREKSRLLELNCVDNSRRHRLFEEITDLLRPDDLLVVNNTKVFPARLLGNKETGGKVEMLLLHFPEPVVNDSTTARAKALSLIKSSKRPRQGSVLHFANNLLARIDKLRPDGKVEVTLEYPADDNLELLLETLGQIPLPPYIRRPDGNSKDDPIRYQTTYARHTGSVAAPTAGLHFSEDLLAKITTLGIEQVSVTLHVGYGTFAPVRCDDIRKHEIHKEYVSVPPATAAAINRVKAASGRIWSVGTTTARTLEFAADKNGRVQPIEGFCGLYIYPGYRFGIVDNLITNFHLPQSSLLFLVSALAGKQQILESYKEAVQEGYRFFSYGDAMAIITRA
ncbi:MAG: tRNA preQ1(34) S-adenosylmethionine ribosyltransferase-isomerase QueA [Desulfobulbus sp.]|nr:MAG: tRNA preQ1(34) S-adenosylmethionine ribosyltransferase-isomerase QueA [Desulfobulbus sp.]